MLSINPWSSPRRYPETGATRTVCEPYYDWENQVTESICWTEDYTQAPTPQPPKKTTPPKEPSTKKTYTSPTVARASTSSSMSQGVAIVVGLGVAFGGYMLFNKNKNKNKR